MNKVVLKEQKKKEKDKEKKKESIRLTKEIIQERLLNHFRYCIGEGEKSTKEEIFQVVTGLNSLAVNSFSRFYWWESIEKVIRKLRKENKCFVIKKNGISLCLKQKTRQNIIREDVKRQ